METQKPKRKLLLVLGFFFVGMAVLGIVLPLVPTTPFLLLAAFLFTRSSPYWHRWLLQHRIFGPYISAFREKRGLTKKQKIRVAASTSVLLWATIYFAPMSFAKIVPALIWIGICGYLLLSKTAKPN